MSEPVEVVTLGTLAQGALLERFQTDFRKLLEDIADVNTEAKTKRSLQLTVEVKPTDEMRDQAEVEVRTKLKLAGDRALHTHVFLVTHHGERVAVENNPTQTRLFDPAPAPSGPGQKGA